MVAALNFRMLKHIFLLPLFTSWAIGSPVVPRPDLPNRAPVKLEAFGNSGPGDESAAEIYRIEFSDMTRVDKVDFTPID